MRNLFLFSILSFLLACRQSGKSKESIIPEDKMETLIWDLMRADQFLTDYVFSKDTSVNQFSETVKMYRRIFEIHQVNREQVKKSLIFYRSHPGRLKIILDSVSMIKIPDPVTNATDTTMAKPVLPQGTQPDSALKPARKFRKATAE